MKEKIKKNKGERNLTRSDVTSQTNSSGQSDKIMHAD